jgi:hypothetical protein
MAAMRDQPDPIVTPEPPDAEALTGVGSPVAEPIVPRLAHAVGDAVGGAVRGAFDVTRSGLDELPGARTRRLRRLSRQPLPYLYEVHPEAATANSHELGVRSINVDEIQGTAVGPPNQRGSDFLPLRPFRSPNWNERWRRVRAAADRLAVLPPIDVLHYGGGYWVVDGHNRVAAALYVGQLEVDADVVELRLDAPGAGASMAGAEPASWAAALEGYSQLQAALARPTPKETDPR